MTLKTQRFKLDEVEALRLWVDSLFSQWFNDAQQEERSEGFLAGGASFSRQLRSRMRQTLLIEEEQHDDQD